MAKVVLQAENDGPVMGAPIASGVTLVEGDLVGLDSSGNIVLATSVSGGNVQARGFVMTGSTIGQFGGTKTLTRISYFMEGKVGGFTGLTIGGTVFLGAAGAITQTEPTTGKIRQCVGYALSATEVWFDIDAIFTIA